MDYVVGSVAALITGNVTPNRPRLIKKARTPTKHQPSPNVTPKSELFGDRSVFLSPTLQRRKDIVKKSPKRIFENPDSDLSNDGEGTTGSSPKADKVKKHLKNDLDAVDSAGISAESKKKSKAPKDKTNMSVASPKINKSKSAAIKVNKIQICNETTPKKKKKRQNLTPEPSEDVQTHEEENITHEDPKTEGISENFNQASQKKKKRKSISESSGNMEIETIVGEQEVPAISHENRSPKKKKKENIKTPLVIAELKDLNQSKPTKNELTLKTNRKKHNKKSKFQKIEKKDEDFPIQDPEESVIDKEKTKKSIKNNNKNYVNLNAITMKDSDSEHESDNDIESETEQINNELLNKEGIEESSDEEEEQQKLEKRDKKEGDDEEEVKRTLFVGNVPFSSKCKKEIKNIFSKYGDIQSIRIRTVPVKDARMTPKLAVIKNELHPDRSTVNVYVKFINVSSVHKALVENNTVLNDHHLRVSPSDDTGAIHDPKCSVFVGNLPFALEDEALRAIFEKCGEIASVRIIRDKKTNAGKGFGYVNFVSKDGVELALGLSEEDLTVKNRIIRVKRVQTNQNQEKDKKSQGGNQSGNFQGRNQSGNFQGRNQGGNFRGRNQGGNFRGRNQVGNFQGRNSGGNFRGRTQGGNFQRGNQDGGVEGTSQRGGFQGRNRGGFQGISRGRGFQGSNRGGFQGRNQGESFQGRNQNKEKRDGDFAFERIMKRKSQESGDGPPDKKVKNINQPIREKKPKKEFVGMTAEKKKKPKFNKGQKKKKALSEILTK